MIKQTITLRTGHGSYPIYIGVDLHLEKSCWATHIPAKQICLISDENVAPAWAARVLNAMPENVTVDKIILPAGEVNKSLAELEKIFSLLYSRHHHRDTCIIALGGGVITDMAGFAAACYQRGVAYLSMPTTLLAQVDAAIGGKTAVNFQQGKNLLGAFHQPQAVLIDIATLTTLPSRELYSGFAEIVKAALIADADFFVWLERNAHQLMQSNEAALLHAIATSCQIKANIVAQDEREHGVRAVLNLGHTFAHAIEAASNYQRFLHGEAVAIGLVMAANLAVQLGMLDRSISRRIVELLKQFKLPTQLPQEYHEALWPLMIHDKKIIDQKLRFIIPTALGQVKIIDNVDYALFKRIQT